MNCAVSAAHFSRRGTVSRLSITRTYNSSDYDLRVTGTGGVFGNAWHHDWEAYLTCNDDQARRDQGLARHATHRVVGEHGVEDPIGDLVGDLVRVTLGHRLGRELEAAHGHRNAA